MKKKRWIIICLIIFFLSIGFAVLTGNLNINGSFSFAKNKFDIHYDNIVVNEGSASSVVPVIDEESLTFDASLKAPGDFYSFNVDIVNGSTVDAMVKGISVSGLDSVSDYIGYSVTYSDGTAIANKNVLYKGYSTTITVKVFFKDIENAQIPDSVLNPKISVSIDYQQANSEAVLVSNTNFIRYNYTGSEQSFVPFRNGTYRIELWGGTGNNDVRDYVRQHPSYAGYVAGDISLTKSDKLYVYVGGVKQIFNTSLTTGVSNIAGSGGATDIRLVNGEWNDATSLASRIMVAGGAGGSYLDATGPVGGFAGGLSSYSSSHNTWPVYSATQTSGGKASSNERDCQDGSFGVGASMTYGGYSPGAGGYYGGGSGPAGGGGSSFISGHTGCVAIKSATDITPKDGCDTGTTDNNCSKHYSGKVFTNTVMIDGKGYSWTNVVGTKVVGMPKFLGNGKVNGNDGEGHAKITILK